MQSATSTSTSVKPAKERDGRAARAENLDCGRSIGINSGQHGSASPRVDQEHTRAAVSRHLSAERRACAVGVKRHIRNRVSLHQHATDEDGIAATFGRRWEEFNREIDRRGGRYLKLFQRRFFQRE